MATQSPIARVKNQFGDKKSLVAAVEKLASEDLWVNRTNANKGLAHVSNAKLLKLHATFTEVKLKFGTRDKLVDAICELEKRTKDEGYRSRLGQYPVPRLYDLYKSAAKRAHDAKTPKTATPKAAKAPKAAAPKAAAAKKTTTKAAAAKKTTTAKKPAAKKAAAKKSSK